MPNKDGTDPLGKGPKTGKQRGTCSETELKKNPKAFQKKCRKYRCCIKE